MLSCRHAGRSNVRYIGTYAPKWDPHLWVRGEPSLAAFCLMRPQMFDAVCPALSVAAYRALPGQRLRLTLHHFSVLVLFKTPPSRLAHRVTLECLHLECLVAAFSNKFDRLSSASNPSLRCMRTCVNTRNSVCTVWLNLQTSSLPSPTSASCGCSC